MIEIKCTAAEKERLTDILNEKTGTCPFIGLCTELPYYKLGMSHRECIEQNIKWDITNAEPVEEEAEQRKPLPDKEITISYQALRDISIDTAMEYYQPEKGEHIYESLMCAGFSALLINKLFEEEK